MKLVIAPDSYKESLSAKQVADTIEKGFRTVFPMATITKVPMADGGEGTVQTLVDATKGTLISVPVRGPLEEEVQAFFGLLGDQETAIIEMASASGLHLVPPAARNPFYTTTIGTGELISKALDYGVKKIIIGIGGSATNDGGAGMAHALGVKFIKKSGQAFFPYAYLLNEIEHIDTSSLDNRIKSTLIEVACDVTNPLTGLNGASYVYGAQKGATQSQMKLLDNNLEHYGKKISQYLHKEVTNIPGSGAAGGLGAGLMAFLDAKTIKGIDVVIDVTKLEDKMKDADLVITGEGQINEQTPFGKTPVGVAKLAKKYGVQVIAIAGSYVKGYEKVYDCGIDAVFATIPTAMPLQEVLLKAEMNLYETSVNVAKLWRIAKQNHK
ncbi:MAG: glycerate kinase [Anaerobacillus sp.]|uniref:glycerate kinase n=1 Tax=Anaerobacillus sp. TaxID=1872506 RepID=UPI00391D63DD